jgi:trigger factor
MAEEAQKTEKPEVKNIVTIEDAGPCKKKVAVEVPEEAVKEALDKDYKELQHEANVPGFRKGRAPIRLLEKRFGKDISEQVKLKLLASASESALKDNKIQQIGEPDIDYEKITLPQTGSLKFDFEVEVRPEFELPSLENIAVNKPKFEVTDKQVSDEIAALQKRSGIWVPQEGGTVDNDDQVIADVEFKAEDVAEEERHDNTTISVKPSGFVAGLPVEKLSDLLIGAKQQDTKTTTVEVAKTFHEEKYRGKKVDIKITIKDIKRLKPAELDQRLFDMFGVKDETDLRAKMRELLADRMQQQTQEAMRDQIYKYLLDNTKFDLPADVVAAESATILQRQYANLMMYGMPREMLEERMGELRASSEERAKEQLKIFFIMDKIADKLGVESSEEEINGHIARVAAQRGRRPEKMREEMIRDGSLAQFALQVREEKCIGKLLETAKIADVEPSVLEESKNKPRKAAAKKKEEPKKEVKEEAKKETIEKTEKPAAKRPVRKKKTEE